MKPEILYIDKYIIVCVKPAGLLSEESGNKRSMPLMLKEYLSSIGERTDIYTLHRLDKNVGGVMVFARNSTSASILAADISGRKLKKEYLAVVRGIPSPESGSMTDLLLHDAVHNKTYIVDSMRKGVREARLRYSTICTGKINGKAIALVDIRLETGRTHQIRVQFASRKMPLIGDGRYGSRDGGDTPALWAYRLEFKHPKTKKRLEFAFPPPEKYPFSILAEQ